jgi:signal peptidase I
MSDRVLVNRLAYEFGSPQRGQIVVFTSPRKANLCERGDGGTTFVKRLIGLPGETVREDHHGFIWIRRSDARTWHVPQGEYFMLGDNRPGSCDSRRWGSVPRSSLIGPVMFTYWPPNRLSYHAGGW